MVGDSKLEKQNKKMLNVISKLMDEQDDTPSELKKVYNVLYSVIEEKLPVALDEGNFTDNASIVRQVNELLDDREIVTVVPEIAERAIIAVWGNEKKIADLFKQLSSKQLGIEADTNLPLLAIPTDMYDENKIFCITYMDKLISLSYDEYTYINKKIYQKNIDVRKLIKCFVVYFPGEKTKQLYCILPEYIDVDNPYLKKIRKKIYGQCVVADEAGKWKKCIGKIPEGELFLFGTEADYNDISDKRDDVFLKEDTEFADLCETGNVPCINFSTSMELQKIFLEVEAYYCKRRLDLEGKIISLGEDSVNIQDKEAKVYINKYRNRCNQLKEELNRSLEKFEKVADEIMKAANNFESSISNILLHDLADDVVAKDYIETLIQVFFKSVYAQKYELAKDVILKLTRANYTYSSAFSCFLKYKQGKKLDPSDVVKIKKYPDDLCEIAKIKLVLAKDLGLLIADLKRLVLNIHPLETGEEYYYYGKQLLDEKNYIEASRIFLKALDEDYEKAGTELIKLAEKHPECQINIEELAENLVAEANYYVGKNCISNKYKKGVVNLKMAASQKHVEAIELVADILFDKYKHISWQNMEKEENRNIINNIIGLYTFLKNENSSEKYNLRIGLMFCKLGDYARSYKILKDIEAPEAQYECGRMCQYGNGVAQNLQAAKKHYKKVPGSYKDTQERYTKVCNILESEAERKKKTSYSEHRDYTPSSSSYSSSSSSDFCFITTAACLALHDNKDCDQLNELRKFRDMHILGDGDDGDELVKEYYRIGPTIVKCIDGEWNPFSIYSELWEDYIVPSYDLIHEERYTDAKLKYIEMVKKLCEKYHISVQQSIMDRYLINVGE